MLISSSEELIRLWKAPAGSGSGNLSSEVEEIFKKVSLERDEAILAYARKFDKVRAKSLDELILDQKAITDLKKKIVRKSHLASLETLEAAKRNLEEFHSRQGKMSYKIKNPSGYGLELKALPIKRAGIYIPGGKNPYPSSVLMNLVPARIAGVEEIIIATPASSPDALAPLVVLAMDMFEIDRLVVLGGAQAIAALALGCSQFEPVDLIVGAGNAFVAEAKQRASSAGLCSIDCEAGPSELAIIADQGANPKFLALDLLAQAEHGDNSKVALVSDSSRILEETEAEVKAQLGGSGSRSKTKPGIEKIYLLKVEGLEAAAGVIEKLAPEHLQLMVARPKEMIGLVGNSAAVFAGYRNSAVFGDYCIGTNHVLPTSGRARFSSPLGVHSFMKLQSVVQDSAEGFETAAVLASSFAEIEGFEFHEKAAKARLAG